MDDGEDGPPGPQDSFDSRSSVSFKFQKKAQPPIGKLLVQDGEKKDFVLSLAGNRIESTKPATKEAVYIIPLRVGKQKTLMEGGQRASKSEGSSTGKGEEGGEGKSEEEMQLDREAVAAVLKDVEEAEFGQQEVEEEDNSVISMMMRNKLELPNGEAPPVKVSTEEEYDEMPIEQFGKAMLRGMGWKEGVALGKTGEGLVHPIELIGRCKGLGLGAMPKPTEPPKRKRIRKQGEEERKVQGPYVDKDGRVRHIKNLGEAIPEQPLRGFVVGNYARVVVGQHEDLYGKIVKVEEKSKHVLLKMAINDQVMRFSQHHLELVSREEYRLGRPVGEEETRKDRGERAREKEYGLILRKRKGGSEAVADSTSEQLPKDKRSKPETERKYVGVHEDGSRDIAKRTGGHHGDASHQDDRHHHGDRRGVEAPHRGQNSRVEGSGEVTMTTRVSRVVADPPPVKRLAQQDHWLSSNLIVKMADRTYKKGRHYNTKVIIEDVVSIGVCVCRTEAGQLLEGVAQNMLETVVPKGHCPVVRIVRGENKNKLATVIDQDRARAEAVIQLNLSKEVMNVDFDDICEYLVKEDEDNYIG